MAKTQAHYVDGFVLTIPKKKLAQYKKMAEEGRAMWLKYDLRPKGVTFTFPKMAKAKPSEVVVFSYITYKSRKHRDEVNAKVMASMTESDHKDESMPFDMKRMAFGGFEVLVSA